MSNVSLRVLVKTEEFRKLKHFAKLYEEQCKSQKEAVHMQGTGNIGPDGDGPSSQIASDDIPAFDLPNPALNPNTDERVKTYSKDILGKKN